MGSYYEGRTTRENPGGLRLGAWELGGECATQKEEQLVLYIKCLGSVLTSAPALGYGARVAVSIPSGDGGIQVSVLWACCSVF